MKVTAYLMLELSTYSITYFQEKELTHSGDWAKSNTTNNENATIGGLHTIQ